MQHPYAVAIVLDPSFGDRLAHIAARLDTWVVPSGLNRIAVEELWRAKSEGGHQLTLWSSEPSSDEAQRWSSILFDVENHHGEFAHDPPVSILEVFGAEPTSLARAALEEYGYVVVEPTQAGFRASRKPRANST
jgi:hypothetical protein